MAQDWRSLEAPGAAAPLNPNTAKDLTVYYQFRDADGEMHIVDTKELVPHDAKGLHKVYLRTARQAVAAPAEVPFLRQTETASQSALNSVALQLGVAPPPPAPLMTTAPVTAAQCIVPAIPPIHTHAFSTPMFGGLAVLLAVGMFPRATRGFCMRILVMGISMATLGTVYMSWARAHGYGKGMTPAALLQNAADTAQGVNARTVEEQRVLDAIGK